MEQKFKLIEGNFSASDAKELLLTLLEEKIKFHELHSFSSEVKKGSKNQESLLKVEELRTTRKNIINYLESEDGGVGKFNITSFINIKKSES